MGFNSPDGIPKLLNQLAKNPNSALFAAIAEELRKQGRYSQALEICKRGIERNPHYANGFFTLGHIYFDMKHYPEAQQQFSKTLQLDPDHLKALEKNAQVAVELKEWNRALAFLERLLTLCPMNNQAQKWADSLREKLYKQAAAQKKQLLVSTLHQKPFTKLFFRLRIVRQARLILARN